MNKKLKARIIERFGTQADFAQTINADPGLISRVVRNRRILPKEDQRLWAKLLGAKPDEIFQSGD